jgi:3',5'-nucleoside bisphosphate phosphatase
MVQVADLHIHTTFSDGILTPEEILQKAVKNNLYAISITDHDTIDGCLKAYTLLDKYPIELITGLELSAYEGAKEYHILGYAVDLYYKPLREHLAEFRISRFERAKRMVKKLQKLGMHIDIDQVLNRAGEAPIIRPHIASVLIDEHYVKDLKEAFYLYLGDGMPAYEEKAHFSVERAIRLINKSGGLAVLAHPSNSINQSTLYKMIKYGMDGIEIVHPSHNEETQKYYHAIASQYWLLGTGGSDYHGSRDEDEVNFGKYVVPYTVAESMRYHKGSR